jgi:hypothetical protein
MSFIHLVSFRVIALGIGFFFPIKLLGMPLTSSRLLLYGLVGLMLWHVVNRRLFLIKRNVVVVVILFLMFISLALLTQFRTAYFDITLFLNFFEIFILYPIGLVGFIKLYNQWAERPSFDNLLFNFLIILFLQGLLMNLMFFIPAIKDLYLSIIDFPKLKERYYFRQIGFSGSSTYNMGIFLNLYPFILFYLVSKQRQFSTVNSFFYVLSLFIVMFPSLITSRTGVLILFFFFPFIFFLYREKSVNTKTLNRFLLFCLFLFLIFVISITVYIINDSKLITMFLWSFDVFISLINFQLPSGVTVLSEHYWMPSLKTLWIGDGYYSGESGYYMGTDGGYMRLILFFGLIGSFTLMITLLIWGINALRYLFKRDISMFWLAFFIIITMIITQYKGNILIDGNELIKFILLVYLSRLFYSYTPLDHKGRIFYSF